MEEILETTVKMKRSESECGNELKKRLLTYERSHVLVELDAIAENVKAMKHNIAADTQIIGVIKTDGYGHGAIPIAHCLERMDYMYGFAVATAEEAHILRGAGITKPILILGYVFPYSYEQLAAEEVRIAVFREDSLHSMAEAAERMGTKIKVHIKVDTGMSRIGISPDAEGLSFVRELKQYPELEVEGIFTHFARADEADKTDAKRQLKIFEEFVVLAERELGCSIPLKHCSNSAGIIELPKANMDVVRAGISLYGLRPSKEVSEERVPVRPALSWYSTVVYIKTIHKGQSVSYGATFTAQKDMRIATIPVGYGDGYPRGLSNKGEVLIRGHRARILGRVCMDQFMVDVTELPQVCQGDKVTLIGRDGGECITAEELGELSGRFNYELVCDIGKRIPRVYTRGGELVAVKDYNNDYE